MYYDYLLERFGTLLSRTDDGRSVWRFRLIVLFDDLFDCIPQSFDSLSAWVKQQRPPSPCW